ncbi:hypothetical protein POM88_047518 [Heracleum sosnowskyi]|uniref:F-box domain-containing protein n=1 Tax=Heracleum sosnowskyi TaxID=360622 RepID=A0AAD8GSB5_9APIA|nr:hypothetical protein POM88_047518 [Heracleum sosnowskyi]
MDSELKRKKARLTLADEEEEEEDRISSLSDDLIHMIMSYLEIQLAVQTCVLSKRWKRVLPELCLTSLPALTTLCLTDWDLGMALFSFNLPGLTTLRLCNCKLPKIDWKFPALKCLSLHDVVLSPNMRKIFASLVSLQNLSLFFYKNPIDYFELPCPQLVNLEIMTRYHQRSGNHNCSMTILAPKLRNVTSVGIFTVILKKSELDNVCIKLGGWMDHMILPREKLKEIYKDLYYVLSEFHSAKNLHLELETIEALSLIADHLVHSPSPFRNLKYVKLPLGCEELNICSTLRSYLLGGSPTATFIKAWPQNTSPSSVPAETAQNVVRQEPLAAPTMVYFDSENVHTNVSIDTVEIGVQEQDVVENSEVHAHKVRHVVTPVGGTGNDRASSSKEISDFGIWRGHEVKSGFVCLLDLIMNKYPETFEHYTTKIKKFCTMELNMLCTSINDFTKMSMAKVDIEVITEYRAVFAELQKYGFGVSWLENRLNYVEQLRFSHPLIPELGAIDCQIDDTKSKLQDLQTKLQDLKTVRAEKLQEIQNVFGTMGANLAVGYIGDDLFSV